MSTADLEKMVNERDIELLKLQNAVLGRQQSIEKVLRLPETERRGGYTSIELVKCVADLQVFACAGACTHSLIFAQLSGLSKYGLSDFIFLAS